MTDLHRLNFGIAQPAGTSAQIFCLLMYCNNEVDSDQPLFLMGLTYVLGRCAPLAGI